MSSPSEIAGKYLRSLRSKGSTRPASSRISSRDLRVSPCTCCASAANRRRSVPKRPSSSLASSRGGAGIRRIGEHRLPLWRCRHMLDVNGQQARSTAAGRHSLASLPCVEATLRTMLAREGSVCYLWRVVHNSARSSPWARCRILRKRAGKNLASEEYDRPLATFHRHIGAACRHQPGRCPSPVLT